MLNSIQNWLSGYLGQVQVDYLDSPTGSLGLFPTGCRVVTESRDVLGNIRRKYRCSFILKRVVSAGVSHFDHAKWLMDFSAWVHGSAAPQLGENTRWYTQNGRLQKVTKAGSAIYSVELMAEYMSLEKDYEN